MMREQPYNITRMFNAFGNHAKRLIIANPKARNTDIEKRVLEEILLPWTNELEQPTESKQTIFIRDYFNEFREIQLACQHLDITRYLIKKLLSDITIQNRTRIIVYWSESYLNDIYIFQCRMRDFLISTQRRYSKDPDFAEPTKEICQKLEEMIFEKLNPLLKIRGTHVHESRSSNSDPHLIRLSHLELLVDGLGQRDLFQEKEKATQEAQEWLLQQIDYFTESSWTIFDSVCYVLSEGIITENDWLIVPTNHKD